MQPLHAILNWWRPLDDFTRPFIAMDVLIGLTSHTDISTRHDVLFHDFLSESIPAKRQIGRVLAVRAIIDFWFLRDQKRRASTMLLDAVEEEDVLLKSLANAALGRIPQVHKAVDSAFETWRQLREADISDALLVSV